MSQKTLLILFMFMLLAGVAAAGLPVSDLLLISSIASIGFFVLTTRRHQPG